jgi:hypothetical protein
VSTEGVLLHPEEAETAAKRIQKRVGKEVSFMKIVKTKIKVLRYLLA